MDHQENGSGLISVYAAGHCPGFAELLQALAGHRAVGLLGARDSVAEAAGELSEAGADVVLWATPDHALPEGELVELHEYTSAPVIALAPGDASLVLEQALALDLADALLLPQPVESVVFAIRRAALARRQRRASPSEGRTTAVFSPKGGSGKTVVAANLAVALSRCQDRRTLLIDLDLQFGDCAVVFGLEPRTTLYDLVTAPGELDAEKLTGFVTRHDASGVDVLSAPARPDEAELVAVDRIVGLLEVARSTYDEVVIDTSPFLHGPNLAAFDSTDDLLLLATLDVPSLKGLRQALQTLELISYPTERVSLVLNRADASVGLNRGEVEAALESRFRFALPGGRAVPLSVNGGNPIVLGDPRSGFAKAVREMARELVDANAAARQRVAVGRA